MREALIFKHCIILPEAIQLTAKRHTCNSVAQQAGELTDAPRPTELLAESERLQTHMRIGVPQSFLACLDWLESAALLAAVVKPERLLEKRSHCCGWWDAELHRADTQRGPGAGATQCPEVGFDWCCKPDAKQYHFATELGAEFGHLQRAVAM